VESDQFHSASFGGWIDRSRARACARACARTE
jgi:hypothetical protein